MLKTMAEVIISVGIAYFLLGGDTWSPKTWAIVTIVFAWILTLNVRREAGLENEKSYLKWKQTLGLLMILALLFGLFKLVLVGNSL